MNNFPLVWIVMGISGSGKTVVGRLLAERLDSDFLEGDRRHPLPNIIKMLEQSPLNDWDRQQWFLKIEDDLRWAIDQRHETVMTCSALKISHRRQIISLGRVQLIWLNVPKPELERRLTQRSNHFMKAEMLQSQLAALEPINPEENVMIVDGLLPPIEIVNEIWIKATQLFPEMNKCWWQRCID